MTEFEACWNSVKISNSGLKIQDIFLPLNLPLNISKQSKFGKLEYIYFISKCEVFWWDLDRSKGSSFLRRYGHVKAQSFPSLEKAPVLIPSEVVMAAYSFTVLKFCAGLRAPFLCVLVLSLPKAIRSRQMHIKDYCTGKSTPNRDGQRDWPCIENPQLH